MSEDSKPDSTSYVKDFLPLLVAEYTSLRGEIFIHLGIQERLTSGALAGTAGLAVLATLNQGSAQLTLVYPVLAMGLAKAWRFHQNRTADLAAYIILIEKSFPLIRWGHFLDWRERNPHPNQMPSTDPPAGRSKRWPRFWRMEKVVWTPIIIFGGTQCLSILTNWHLTSFHGRNQLPLLVIAIASTIYALWMLKSSRRSAVPGQMRAHPLHEGLEKELMFEGNILHRSFETRVAEAEPTIPKLTD